MASCSKVWHAKVSSADEARVAAKRRISMIFSVNGCEMIMQIRQATEADAEEAVSTLRHSITELCFADHRNDPAEVNGWLSNKTTVAWSKWVARSDAIVLVAERENRVVGVGMVTLSGEILLNYVHPKARFSGVSKAILAGMEDVLRSRGVDRCQLESTITAQGFYESCGFRPIASNTLMLSKSL